MVSVRRVKYIVKLSVASLIIFSIILFNKWDEDISYKKKVRRYFAEIRAGDDQHLLEDPEYDSDNYLLLEQERELDVDQILKKLKDEYSYQSNTVKKENTEKIVDVVKVRETSSRDSTSATSEPRDDMKQKEKKSYTTVLSDVTPKPVFYGNFHNNVHSHKFKNEAVKWKKMPWHPTMYGELNVHIWQAWCGSTTHDLRRNKFFPQWPDVHLTTDQFFIRHAENDYGQRVFGYIHPPVSGKYRFAVSSDDNSELWLSTDDSPLNVRLVAWVGNLTTYEGSFYTEVAQFTKYPTQISRPIFLLQGQKYFVEALHKQAGKADHLMVGWKLPGMTGLRHLSGKSVSLYINDANVSSDVTEYAKYIPQDLPSHSHHQLLNVQLNGTFKAFGTVDPRDKKHRASLVNESHIKSLFPSCDYMPSYLVDFKIRRYQGVGLIHDTAIYPDDGTDLIHMKQFDKCRAHRLKDSHGNKLSGSALVPQFNNESLYDDGRIKVLSSSDKVKVLSVLKKEVDEEFQKELIEFEGGNTEGILSSKKLKKRKGRKTPEVAGHYVNTIPNTFKERNVKKRVKKVRKQNPSQHYSVENKVAHRSRNLLSIKDEIVMLQTRDRKDREAARQRRLRIAHAQRNAGDGALQHRMRTGNSQSEERPHVHVARVSLQTRPDRSRLSHKDSSRVEEINQTRLHHYRNKQTHQGRLGQAQLSNNQHHGQLKNSHQRVSRSPQRKLPPWLMPSDSGENLIYRFHRAWQYVRRVQELVVKEKYRANMTALEISLFKRWGVRIKVPSTFYIDDLNPWLFNQNITKCGSDSNLLLNKDVAESVAHRYMKALKRKYGSMYSLKSILNVEENHDILMGDRYLVELELNVEGQDNPVRLSQFVYQKLGETEFCLPTGFVYNPHATVHVIVPVKNQGKWVQYFIEDMSEIYRKTGDPHFNVIIVDFDSDDIDIQAALQRSDLKRYQLIKLSGPFQRALGIQVGTEAVTNNHDIIFTCDLHLEAPNNLIDVIRKHCVEGKMAFAPIVNRLHCGFTPTLPYGFWELQGYGLFAIYKSDYQRIGGMNYREFSTHWGGEDWEMLDRVLAKKLEVERLRIANFYHFFHSRKGMWGDKNIAASETSDKARGFASENEKIVLFEEDPTHYKSTNEDTTNSNAVSNAVSRKISISEIRKKIKKSIKNEH